MTNKERWEKETADILIKKFKYDKKGALEYAEALSETYYDEEIEPLDAILEDFSYT